MQEYEPLTVQDLFAAERTSAARYSGVAHRAQGARRSRRRLVTSCLRTAIRFCFTSMRDRRSTSSCPGFVKSEMNEQFLIEEERDAVHRPTDPQGQAGFSIDSRLPRGQTVAFIRTNTCTAVLSKVGPRRQISAVHYVRISFQTMRRPIGHIDGTL